MLEAVDGCPAPVVARVQGHALGGGAGLVACCDVAVAAPQTVFGFTEVEARARPGVISPFVLAKIGRSAARSYFVTGERFDAARRGASGSCTSSPTTSTPRSSGVVGELLVRRAGRRRGSRRRSRARRSRSTRPRA